MWNSIRYPFVLVTGDKQIFTALDKFIKGVLDSFIRHQVKDVVFIVPRMAFYVPEIPTIIEGQVEFVPVLVEGIINLTEQVHREATAIRRNIYTRTLLKVIYDWMDTEFPHAHRNNGRDQINILNSCECLFWLKPFSQ